MTVPWSVLWEPYQPWKNVHQEHPIFQKWGEDRIPAVDSDWTQHGCPYPRPIFEKLAAPGPHFFQGCGFLVTEYSKCVMPKPAAFPHQNWPSVSGVAKLIGRHPKPGLRLGFAAASFSEPSKI